MQVSNHLYTCNNDRPKVQNHSLFLFRMQWGQADVLAWDSKKAQQEFLSRIAIGCLECPKGNSLLIQGMHYKWFSTASRSPKFMLAIIVDKRVVW
jgi:hypothetical protein